jgi:hypothetical protein
MERWGVLKSGLKASLIFSRYPWQWLPREICEKVRDKMRIRFPIYILSAIFLLLHGRLLVGKLAAQELKQCYVESLPCGTPQHFMKLISYCIQDPNRCRNPEDGDRIIADADSTDAPPANRAGSATPLSVLPLRPGPVGPSSKVISAHVRAAIPSQSLAPVHPAGMSEHGASDAADSPSRIVSEVARDLPLDPAVRNLADTMPADAIAIERQLGLRRTRVAGFDLRRIVPSPDQIVQALAPFAGEHK